MPEELYGKILQMQGNVKREERAKKDRLKNLAEKFVTLAGLKPPHFSVDITSYGISREEPLKVVVKVGV